MRFPLMILFCLLFFAACKTSPKQLMNEAMDLEAQGKYKEAMIKLDKAIALDDKYLEAYINRGSYKSDLGNYYGAIEDYKKVISLDPGNMMALLNIGNCYSNLKDPHTAIYFYNQLMTIKGEGGIYVELNPEIFPEETAFNIRHYEILYQRGVAYYQADSLAKAYSDLKGSVASNFMVADCYQLIGLIDISFGKTAKGCSSLRLAQFFGNKEVAVHLEKYCKNYP